MFGLYDPYFRILIFQNLGIYVKVSYFTQKNACHQSFFSSSNSDWINTSKIWRWTFNLDNSNNGHPSEVMTSLPHIWNILSTDVCIYIYLYRPNFLKLMIWCAAFPTKPPPQKFEESTKIIKQLYTYFFLWGGAMFQSSAINNHPPVFFLGSPKFPSHLSEPTRSSLETWSSRPLRSNAPASPWRRSAAAVRSWMWKIRHLVDESIW